MTSATPFQEVEKGQDLMTGSREPLYILEVPSCFSRCPANSLAGPMDGFPLLETHACMTSGAEGVKATGKQNDIVEI